MRVRIHWPRLRCMVSSMGVYRRSMPTLTRTRDCGSRLAERLAQPLSRRRALLAREEVETRLNRVPCHHGIFVKVQSCTAVKPFMSIANSQQSRPPHMPILCLLSVCASRRSPERQNPPHHHFSFHSFLQNFASPTLISRIALRQAHSYCT